MKHYTRRCTDHIRKILNTYIIRPCVIHLFNVSGYSLVYSKLYQNINLLKNGVKSVRFSLEYRLW